MNRPPKYYVVPIGSRSKPCTGPTCKNVVWWIRTPTGAHLPVDCSVEGGKAPTANEDGIGVSEWGTCADAKYFAARKATR